VASLFDPKPFWFYMVLDNDGDTAQVPLPGELNREALKRSLDAAIQRLAPGFLKTIAVLKPKRQGLGGNTYTQLTDTLSENARLKDVDLKDGRVPSDADLLLVLAPDALDDKQVFAIDQFLMQGGSVVLATSPFEATLGESLTASKHHSGLEDWLKFQGLGIDDGMVLDPQNAALPVPVQRHVGGFAIREIQMMNYPYFPDIRGAGLNSDNPITSALGQVTLNWVSPVMVDKDKNQARKVIRLLSSSPQSWVSSDLNILPDYRAHPDNGFAPSGPRGSRLLALDVEGRFDSFFKGKESPLAKPGAASQGDKDKVGAKAVATPPTVTGVIERSPDSARIILVASNTFASDTVLDLASEGMGTRYTRPLEFLQNAIDWSLEDRGLLAIRSRAQFARTLRPMSSSDEMFWEYLNYALALAGLLLVWLWRRRVRQADRVRYQAILAEV
jgi:gliding motility-associated transport system permease protein/gliding motility-associatede transport system auxiliary component